MSTEEDNKQNKFKELPPDIWMVRPCDVYKDEYKDCKSIKSRHHQYYVFGKFLDCNQWKKSYENCLQFKRTYSTAAYEEIIAHEKARRLERLAGAYGNNVWEYRTSPPLDWSAPIPEWSEANENSLLAKYTKEKSKDPNYIISKDFLGCVIL
ncbi:hypothetical protein CHS0354_024394 [Potamilus streckersoni]|uniref:Synaptic plasticity regulator PANTS n=1 Tax=Potamilus streckersoni TaxID=2493646 RepID=A0AAE0W1X6_9BIVA|nr:hypothetical protein CHS0354_024394 [Potamilus streckersoni]